MGTDLLPQSSIRVSSAGSVHRGLIFAADVVGRAWSTHRPMIPRGMAPPTSPYAVGPASTGGGAKACHRAALRVTVLALVVFVGARAARGEPGVEDPSRVEAAFLRNFAHYVRWPAAAFEGAQSPWHIGVLGSPRFGEVLEMTLKGRVEQNRGFAIHSTDSLEKLPHCHIIFIAFDDSSKRRAVLDALKSKPVLTVGEAREILREGGIIRLELSDRVQMSINLDQAHAASLTIPTAMLEVSTEVLEHGVIRRMR
jgi:hypothetical protein